MSELTAIIARHDADWGNLFKSELERLNYKVTLIHSLHDLLEQIQSSQYSVYMMDVNLGHSRTDDISSLEKVWEHVGSKVKSGEARLIGFSSYRPALRKAKALLGIPEDANQANHSVVDYTSDLMVNLRTYVCE